MNILEAMSEASNSATKVEKQLILYIESVREAAKKFEELADVCKDILDKPHLRIDDFEIDG